jgi:hypothetical protein
VEPVRAEGTGGMGIARRWPVAAVVAVALLMVSTTTALADQITNNLDGTVDSTLETLNLTPNGSTGSVGLFVIPLGGDGKNGCNLTGQTSLVVNVTTTNPSVAAVSPAQITFTSCNTAPIPQTTITVTPHAAGSANVGLTVASNTTGGNFDLSTATFTVSVVQPNTAPTLSLPANLTVEATSSAGAVVTYTATATDAEEGALTPSCSRASGSTFPLGTTTVNCSVTDHGTPPLTTTGSFTVTARDTTPPALSLPNDITAEATGPGGAIVTFTKSATDLVDGPVTANCNRASGSTFVLGTTTVSCSATDAHGNTANGSFKVTVQDTTAPTFLLSNLQAEATSSSGAVVTYTASASDLVDGTISALCSPASDSTLPLGPTTINCAATDAHGNTGHGSFIVTVNDTSAPVLALPADITKEATGPSGAAVTYTASANDIVDGSVATVCTPASGATFPVGMTTVGCSATDAHSNTASGTFHVTVVDTTPPTLALPDDITAEATSLSGAAMTFTTSATDIVDGAVAVDCDAASGGTFALGTTTVTCTASDSHGNTATGDFHITVEDTTPPTVTVPADITVEATGSNGAAVNFAVSASDAVDGNITPQCNKASGGTFPVGTTTVTCSATDAHSNTGQGNFHITVKDTTPPNLTLPSNITAEATGPNGALVSYTASANDIVDGPVAAVCTPTSGTTFVLGMTTVSCTATDAHNNSATETFVVTVQDTTPPVLSVPDDITAEATGPAGAVVDFTTSATDIVDGGITPNCSAAAGDSFPLGTTTVDCTATDAHGNTSQDSFDVIVQDTTPPSFKLTDLTLEATSASGAIATYSVSATDIVDGTIPATCAPPSGSTFPLGLTTITCAATDAHGNTGSGIFKVNVRDTTAPVLSLPGDLTAEATGPSGATVTYSATANDIVDGPVTPICAPPSGATFALGTTDVGCTATDAHANTATGAFHITIEDTTPPTLTLPGNVVAEASGPNGAAVSFTASATDIVDGTVALSCSKSSGSTFALGTTTVNCSASDAHHNTAAGSFTVTVQDTTAPALSIPSNMTVEATGANGAAVSFTASATDLVDGSVTPVCTPTSGAVHPLGTTTVTCTVTDAHGNTATGTFGVTVQDTTAPALTLPSDITKPASGNSAVIVSYLASAHDLVDGNVSISCVPPSGSSFAVGTTTVTCTATDSRGNAASGAFHVTVNYAWTGFFQPVSNTVLNNVNAGSAVPVKFSLGGYQGMNIFATTAPNPKLSLMTCGGGQQSVTQTVTAGNSSLSYDPTANQYVYVWKTDKLWAGKCGRLDVQMADGTLHSANFNFK